MLRSIRSFVLLTAGVAFLPAGCGSDSSGGTSPEVAQAQHRARDAWEKSKADGTERKKSANTNVQGPSQRGRSHR